MRILYLNADPGVPIFGPKGASVHVRSMARAMAARGHQVTIQAARNGDGDGVSLAALVLPEWGGPGPGDSPAQRELGMLRQREAMRDRLRETVRETAPDLIYERYSMWCDAGVSVATALGLPHLLEVNAPLIDESLCFRALHHRAEAESIARCVFAGTGTALAVSRAVAEHVRSLGGRGVRLFPNAVDPERFGRPSSNRGSATGQTLGFCGSLRPWHGVEALAMVLAEVRSALPGATLLVVGDGPGRDALIGRAREFGIEDAVRITGPLPHEQVPRWLEAMDLALAPYPRLEPFWFSPLKVFEYQAAGLPVIASRQGDLPLTIDHGRTGVLVEPNDLAGMAGWAIRLLQDRALARAMGDAARREILERHTWPHRVAEIEALVYPAAGSLRV